MDSTEDSPAISISLNGQSVTTRAATLAGLVGEQGFAGRKVATAVNGLFVPERARAATALAPGDSIEVLTARQGG